MPTCVFHLSPLYLVYIGTLPPSPLLHADIPGSLQVAVHGLVRALDYVSTVREVMVAGGCNCSRLGLVGACLGSQYGLKSIPMEWLEKTDSAKHALQLALELVKNT